jgi:ATP-dependent DNA helicase RecQ
MVGSSYILGTPATLPYNAADYTDVSQNAPLLPSSMSQTLQIDPEVFLPKFGLTGFRPGQREVIEAVLRGEDCLLVMPTGGGKSLCYQLPAIAQQGVTLVVSPLIALMKDQVDQLQSLGLRATLINSTLTGSEQATRLQGMTAGEYDLVYVVPERFRSPRFVEAVRGSNLRLLAIDEAHCISEWGHDFRPDYARLGQFRGRLGNPPTIALTATATPRVRDDIVALLNLQNPKTLITGFVRPNLRYEIQACSSDIRKDEALLRFLNENPGSGIIYASTRKRCEEVAERVMQNTRRSAGVYHAGMQLEDRRQSQEDFMQGRKELIVATNAFGMGIDKADVRFVIHYNLPGTLEAYYQEAGRAGRDGLPSRCLLLHTSGDRRIQEFFIESSYPDRHVVKQVYDFLREQQEDPIELTQLEIKEQMHLQVSGEGVGNCEQLLEKAGALERLEPLQNMAIARLDSELPTLVDLLPKQAKAQRRVLQALERIVGERRYENVYFPMRDLLTHTDMELTALSRTLRELCRLQSVDYVPPFRGRAVHLIQRDTPFEKLQIDFETLERRKAGEYQKLDAVAQFANSRRCRQQQILDYFGQAGSDPCGRCDQCSTQGFAPLGSSQVVVQDPDVLETVRIALSGVARSKGRFGKNLIVDMLCGADTVKIKRYGLEKLSTYGLLTQWKRDTVSELLDALLMAGCLTQVELSSRRPLLQLTDRGRRIMVEGVTAGELVLPGDLVQRLTPAKRRGAKAAVAAAPTSSPAKPPAAPTSQTAPPSIHANSGVTESDSLMTSDPPDDEVDIIDAVDESLLIRADEDESMTASASPSSSPSNELDMPAVEKRPENLADQPQHYWTWRLLSQGFKVDECMQIRGLAREVVLDHALRAMESGCRVEVGWFLSPHVCQAISQVVGDAVPARIRPLMAKLPAGIRYEEVQLFLKCRGDSAVSVHRKESS